jgi:undecaprenyl-diphosphatase
MEWFEALILGIIQGLTEFLPVSSSGHLEIGKALFGISGDNNLYFSIVVHGATVLSTIVVFWKDLVKLGKGAIKFQKNDETTYLLKIGVSMIPVVIVGLFFKDQIKTLFDGSNINFVGFMLLVTALLLAFTYFFKGKKQNLRYIDAFIIGIAQAFAVLPGISRSGATIATGLMLGKNKEEIAKFSFLMVLIPILGENFLDLLDGSFSNVTDLSITSLLIGFIAAFLSGLVACKLMLRIVKKGKLIWFALYCAIIGIVTILFL